MLCGHLPQFTWKVDQNRNLAKFEHCSESFVWPIGSHIWSLFAPIHMKSWPIVKLFAPKQFYPPLFGPKISFWFIFSLNYNVPIFINIYIYLTLNYPYLGIIAINWPDLTIFFLYRYSSIETFRAIGTINHGYIAFQRIGGYRKCCHECSLGVYCIPCTKYVRGILWFSRRSAAASASAATSADTSSFSR